MTVETSPYRRAPKERRKLRLAPAISVAIALFITATSVWGVLRGDRVTGARRVDWGRSGGELEFKGCYGDTRLGTFVLGDRVFTTCAQRSTSITPNGALAAIDTSTHRGAVNWLMPADLPLLWSEGLLASQRFGSGGMELSDLFAYVYRANGRLVAAIAGRDGWASPPQALPGTQSRLLGMTWLGPETLEIVVAPGSTDDEYGLRTDPVVVTISPTMPRAERKIARGPFCRESVYLCTIAVAYYYHTGWTFLVNWLGREPGSGGVDSATESGHRQVSNIYENGLGGSTLPYHFDTSGLLVSTNAKASYVSDSLYPIRSAPPINDAMLGPIWKHYYGLPKSTSVMPRWWVQDRRAYVQYVDERVVESRRTDRSGDETLSIVDRTTPGRPHEIDVARTASHACSTLDDPTFVRTHGGYTLVDTAGCYIEVDTQFRRKDPLSLFEHLRRRGSRGFDWNEWWHAWTLGWALFGWPIALAVAAAVSLAQRRRIAFSTSATVFYAVTALVALYRVWPLLR